MFFCPKIEIPVLQPTGTFYVIKGSYTIPPERLDAFLQQERARHTANPSSHKLCGLVTYVQDHVNFNIIDRDLAQGKCLYPYCYQIRQNATRSGRPRYTSIFCDMHKKNFLRNPEMHKDLVRLISPLALAAHQYIPVYEGTPDAARAFSAAINMPIMELDDVERTRYMCSAKFKLNIDREEDGFDSSQFAVLDCCGYTDKGEIAILMPPEIAILARFDIDHPKLISYSAVDSALQNVVGAISNMDFGESVDFDDEDMED